MSQQLPISQRSPRAAGRGLRGLAACALALIAATSATARDGDSSGVTLDSRTFIGNPRDVVVVGGVAYLALDSGLAIQDVTDPAAPLLLSHVYLPSTAFDLAVRGDLVFVANGESGLVILDASDLASPVVLATLPTQGTRGVSVSGSTAFLAEASDAASATFGLRVVDVSNPASPSAIGFVALPNGALDVVVAGGKAYVGYGSEMSLVDQGLAIVDVSNPSSPSLDSVLDVRLPVHEVAVEGSVAYLAAGFPFVGAFVVADVSSPTAPAVLRRVQLEDAGMGVAVDGGVAHVAARAKGLLAFDVNDPSAPILMDAVPTGRETWAVAVEDDVAFLGERSSNGAGSFTSVALSPPPDCFTVLDSQPFAEAMDVAAGAGLALVVRRDGLSILDATDPTQLALLSTLAPPRADLTAISIDGDTAAIAQGDVVRIVDFSDPANPAEEGQVSLSRAVAVDVHLQGDVLFVVDGLGLETFDVSDPQNPTALGTYSTSSWAAAVDVDGARAALVAGDTLEMLDVTSPGSPVLDGVVSLGEPLYGVALDGDLAVVVGLVSALATVDVSSPGAPVVLASMPGGPGFDVELVGTKAFVAAGEAGLLVVDVAEPAVPFLDAYHDTSGTAVGVAVEGAVVHLATEDAQHWTLTCQSCIPSCVADADAQPPSASICDDDTATFAGGTSTIAGCPDALEYQWLEDGVALPGQTGPDLVVPAGHAAGTFDLTLEVSCPSLPSCTDSAAATLDVVGNTWPVLAVNSLRHDKRNGIEILSWQVVSGSGDTNLHRSLLPWDLSDGSVTPATVVEVVPGTSTVNTFAAGILQPIFYKVFGRKSCSGVSVAP